jgi:hypothetical protein
LIEGVALFSCQFNHPLGETIIVLLLLDGVVESGMPKVFLPVGNQKCLQLKKDKR